MAISDRERKMLIFGLGGLAVFVLLYFIVPAIIGGDSSKGGPSGSSKDLESIISLYQDFSAVQAEYNKMEQAIMNNKNFSLLSELETMAAQAEINIDSIESTTLPKNEFFTVEAVDIRLSKVNLVQLMTFLHTIEYSDKVLRVKKLHVDVRFDNPDLMNAEIRVNTFKPLG